MKIHYYPFRRDLMVITRIDDIATLFREIRGNEKSKLKFQSKKRDFQWVFTKNFQSKYAKNIRGLLQLIFFGFYKFDCWGFTLT